MARKPVPTYSLLEALEATAAIIRTHGYISKKVAGETGGNPTSMILCTWLRSPTTSAPVVEDADRSAAKTAFDWLTKLGTSVSTDRVTDFDMSMRNLVVGGYRNLDAGLICKSDFGFIACVYATMERAANREKNKEVAKESASTSEYIGSLKTRAEFFVKLLAKNYSDNVGCYIYKIKDRKGNLGVFFSSDSTIAEVEDCFLAKMTPKRHSVNEYHGGKETVFNRVKVSKNVGAAG